MCCWIVLGCSGVVVDVAVARLFAYVRVRICVNSYVYIIWFGVCRLFKCCVPSLFVVYWCDSFVLLCVCLVVLVLV